MEGGRSHIHAYQCIRACEMLAVHARGLSSRCSSFRTRISLHATRSNCKQTARGTHAEANVFAYYTVFNPSQSLMPPVASSLDLPLLAM